VIRFGIRRDDGHRPTRGLVAIAIAIATGSLALPAAAQARAPRASVVVVAKHGHVPGAQSLTLRLGGSVGKALPIVDGFVALVPARSLRRPGAGRPVRAIGRNGGVKLSATDPGVPAFTG